MYHSVFKWVVICYLRALLDLNAGKVRIGLSDASLCTKGARRIGGL